MTTEPARAEVAGGGRAAAVPRSAGGPAGPEPYYAGYHLMVGITLGFIGAAASLLFNVVGSLAVGQHPLQLIRIYLTFPLGARALSIETGAVLAVGCCLYLATGGLLGVPFHFVLSLGFNRARPRTRFLVATVLGVGLWLVNFYAILAWLQPLLFQGRWIVEQVPAWVGAGTHLIFAWTMVLTEQLERANPVNPAP